MSFPIWRPAADRPINHAVPSDWVPRSQFNALLECRDGAIKHIEALESERDQLRKELEEASLTLETWKRHNIIMAQQVSSLTTENAALKEKLKTAEFSLAIENGRFLDSQDELTSLRSQFHWTPISERLPTERDANKDGYVLQADHKVAWSMKWDTIHPMTVQWMSIPELPRSSPPETEEQAMRREFEAWANENRLSIHREVNGDYSSNGTAYAWIGFQAARQSTGGRA